MGAVQGFLLFLFFTIPLAMFIYALFDSSKYAEATWELAKLDRKNWTIAILLGVFFGPMVYFLQARPKLRKIEPDAAAVDLDPGNDDLI